MFALGIAGFLGYESGQTYSEEARSDRAVGRATFAALASWEQIQKTAQSDMDVPGRCYAHLIDGSALLIDRLARQHFGQCRIWTSHPVTDVSGARYRPTTIVRDLAVSDTYGPDNPRLMAGGLSHGA